MKCYPDAPGVRVAIDYVINDPIAPSPTKTALRVSAVNKDNLLCGQFWLFLPKNQAK